MGEGKYCIASDGELCGPGLQPLPFKVWYTPRNLETLGDIAFAQGAAMEREKMVTFRNWIKENSGQFYDGGKRILAKMDELSGAVKDAGIKEAKSGND